MSCSVINITAERHAPSFPAVRRPAGGTALNPALFCARVTALASGGNGGAIGSAADGEPGMVDDEVKRARELRDTAARLRRLARQTRSPEARQGLCELAERFEAMAARIDPEDLTC